MSLIKLFILSAVGYGAVRTGLLSTGTIEALSKFVINITLPSLILVTLGTRLDASMMGVLALGVLAALALNGGGLVLAIAVRRFLFPKEDPSRNLFVSLSAIQNAGYLPIPLVTAVLPEESRSLGLLLVFFYILVMNPLFWSVGVRLITDRGGKGMRDKTRSILNPPLIVLIAGFLFLIPPVRNAFISLDIVTGALSLVGNATIPIVLVILGGSFGTGISVRGGGIRIIAGSTILKLIVIPTVVLLTVNRLNLEQVFRLVLILEASMPAAMNHIVVARGYGGNVPLTARTLFVQYALSVVTVPLFLYLGAAGRG